MVGIGIPLLISFISYCKIYQLVRTSKSARNQIVARFRKATFEVPSQGNSVVESNPNSTLISCTVDPKPGRTQASRISKTKSQAFQQELTLVRTLFRSFAVFLVAWLPLAILLMLAPVIGVVLPSWVYLFTVFLAHGSTATNSVLYYSTNRIFRRSFRAMTAEYLVIYSGHSAQSGAPTVTTNSHGNTVER